MTSTPTIQEALIYAMVTMSAVDGEMSEKELRKVGSIVKQLPIFKSFDPEHLVKTATNCGEIMSASEGLHQILDIISSALPEHLYETAYALAVEVAAADLNVRVEEIRFLELLRDHLNLDKLTIAALERGARARYQSA